MRVKIKRLHDGATIPSYAKEGDAGLDLVAVSKGIDSYGNLVYGTGLAIEIPKGYVGLLYPRSSISKTKLILANSVGVIDSGYRGEIMLKFRHTNNIMVYSNTPATPLVGDRVGQLMIVPYPQIEFVEVDSLETSDRGDGGFGSTGG